MADLTPETLAEWRENAESWPATGTGSTHARRILALLDALAEVTAERDAVRGEHEGGWFWSQSEWANWSNELATLLPEDAVCWPGATPEGAQEAIIEAALKHLVAERDAQKVLRDQISEKTRHYAHLAGQAMDTQTREWLVAFAKTLQAFVDEEATDV